MSEAMPLHTAKLQKDIFSYLSEKENFPKWTLSPAESIACHVLSDPVKPLGGSKLIACSWEWDLSKGKVPLLEGTRTLASSSFLFLLFCSHQFLEWRVCVCVVCMCNNHSPFSEGVQMSSINFLIFKNCILIWLTFHKMLFWLFFLL